MNKFALPAIAVISALCGCATMADTMSKAAGMGVVRQTHSTFDDATVITASPTVMWAKGSWGNQIKMGARWSSANPDDVALLLAYDSSITSASSAYLGLHGIDINVDGKITSFSAATPTQLDSSSYNTVSNTIYTDSTNAVVIPYALLERMVASNDCRLRIHTSKGYEDAQFSLERIPGGQGTAILPIKEMMQKVALIRQP